VILIDAHPRQDWLLSAVEKRLREELAALQVEINEEKSRRVDLSRSESFGYLGFDFRRVAQPSWVLASKLHAKAQEAHCAVTETQGGIPPPPIATSRQGDPADQPGARRLGELLRGWKLQRVLQLHSRLDREEDTAPYDASSETKGLRLDEVE